MIISKIKNPLDIARYTCSGWVKVPHNVLGRKWVSGKGQTRKAAINSAFKIISKIGKY